MAILGLIVRSIALKKNIKLVYEVGDFTEFLIKKYQHKTVPDKKNLTLNSFNGILKSSPSFKDDPLEIQQKMRNEWD